MGRKTLLFFLRVKGLVITGIYAYFNLLAWLIGSPLKCVKCFCLCGLFDREECTGFAIGTEYRLEAKKQDRFPFLQTTVGGPIGIIQALSNCKLQG